MVFESIKRTIMDIMGIPEDEILQGCDIYNDLDADSLDMSQIIIALENEYKIEIENEEIAEFKTVKDIADSIEIRINK
ncbi:acyl carrier protein [Peptoclostridium litorale DSM 5388]|uniref:Acyl carrier protein n=1 Tax=Peptoclostridium litorale DSM 5388 TaxID=1121324 RepID=A0A069RR49_PEPLI|nr:phosphopantetheine-binding protein [Peptoclostridium litorale]KDR96637.1 hypothetical protein CLIT_2c02430 [Peptoclostridium litorale DSM 5388]SIN68206.1 acyl carrier protein [Peptoclostridium litorale DSM 5388]